MVLSYPQFIKACGLMREKGLCRKTGPLVVSFAGKGMYQPTKYYWDDSEPEVHVMMNGPRYYNDNISYSGRNR